ncbi:MAG: hypothetical protein KDA92_06255 [Planctomycetales bacterium]|nr:hypothetical protein [Planctomycetales bacterium]
MERNANSYMIGVRRIAGRMLVASLLLVQLPSFAFAQFGSGGFGGAPGGAPGPKTKDNSRPEYQAPVFEKRERGEPVVGVKIVGNQVLEDAKIRTHLQTRVGRDFDPDTVRADVRRLSSTGMFRNVRTYRKQVDGGVEVTYEVFELPLIQYLKFVGNDDSWTWTGRKGLSDKSLRKAAELKVGEPLQRFKVEEARRKIQELYLQKGFTEVQVEVMEGLEPTDEGVVFSIYEGAKQRIYKTEFVGNTIATDGRLKTQIKSKPGIMWLIKGQVDLQQIDEDKDRLTAYYRSLGFFKARVGRDLDFGDDGKWLTVRFIIDEGPRYKIRQVSIVGNETFASEALMSRLQLKSGDYFDARRMNMDLNELRDVYGSQGYIHADVQADPRFLVEPGTIDLVYDVQEGEQFRVGKIIVNIAGDNPHTRRNVVINRISLAPNDIIDIREIRDSERRLRSSQLFATDPASGAAPSIEIQLPENAEFELNADQRNEPGSSTLR